MVAYERHEDRHVLGRESHTPTYLAHDLDSGVGVVAREPLPDVVQQGPDEKEIRPVHVARERGGL
jgi:hypothetical protein